MNMNKLLVPRSRSGWLAAGLFSGVLLALAGLSAGCIRADKLPTDDGGVIRPMSQPPTYDVSKVPLDRDPTQIYRVGPKDVIRVDVRKDTSLSGEYAVTDEGNVLLPNIGPVRVADLTTSEIQAAMDQTLERYIKEPDVRVGVKEYKSKIIYVLGQVANPGPQVMSADMMTLEAAVHAAGLPTPQAAMQRTQVIRPGLNYAEVYEVDLSDVLYKGLMRENVMLQPNDRVYVPAGYTTNLRAAIREVLGPIEDVQRARNSVIIAN
jgi:polysaccharide export outer membrane protein